MTSTDPLTTEIRRSLNNMRAYIRRQGITGWVKDRNIAYGYERAFTNLIRLEDRDGIDAVAKFDDRLTALRQEAMRAGLITAGEVLQAERNAIATIDAENARRAS